MALFGRKKPAPVEEEVVEEAPSLPPAPPLNETGLRTVADHTDYLLSLVEPLRPFGMSLVDAWDQVMCEDINSMINVPPNSTAKVEGFAVRASDLRQEDGSVTDSLRIVDADERLAPGEAARVMPGAVLPRGTTAVLPSTFGQVLGAELKIIEPVDEGAYLRAAGEHLAVGTRLLSEGERLNDRAIGMLASAGIDKVLVRPRPRVVVVSSGHELVEPGDKVHHGENTDSNSFMIAAAARAAGATVFRVALHTSDPEQLKMSITDQLIRADLLISTTGGHREDYEAVARAMGELGLVDSVEVAMSPGRTQTFGLIGDERVPMVMLPGNPVSAYVSFQTFVWPLIRRLMGGNEKRRAVRAIASSTLRSNKGQLHLLRGELFSEASIRTVERVSDPHAMAELSRSNALIVLDEQTDLVKAGEQVMCWPLDES
ncbi:molybdopterin molybdotransferase MoeA [Tessaracoccus sp. OS52]|uniref:molybdopterin molybdotransferase MoeA n=1 Tax=Tessaracoccus sp. OS52 TaxID=2886691 RepID=UPI001D12D397|nr:gephyrin-like molybdotransferase Glp [Tessaracoccus sp. OS52]MCC2592054.1 molybdopterin molybdotransferase MoeA [Tessaracoccus sp. OS52]